MCVQLIIIQLLKKAKYLYIEIPRGIVGIELDSAVVAVAKKKI